MLDDQVAASQNRLLLNAEGNQFIGVILSHDWTMKKYNVQTKSYMLTRDGIVTWCTLLISLITSPLDWLFVIVIQTLFEDSLI